MSFVREACCVVKRDPHLNVVCVGMYNMSVCVDVHEYRCVFVAEIQKYVDCIGHCNAGRDVLISSESLYINMRHIVNVMFDNHIL